MAAKGNTLSKTFVWILMGLLFVGLAGFGATSLSGSVRSIGSVGDETISTDDYFRAVQRELRALTIQSGAPVSFRDAQQAGVVDQVISRLVTVAALDHETAQMGISVSDERLGREILQIPSFQGIDGSFDRQAYAMALQNNGWTEAEFEEDLRQETSRSLLQASIVAGNPMPAAYTDALLSYLAETRDFTFGRVTESVLSEPVPAPTDAELTAYHAANQDRYTIPETRQITYVWVTPEMMLDSVDVDEAALRAEYEANAAQYIQPERRLVERLVMGSTDEAETARAAIDAGETSFDAVVESRGLSLSEIDLGDVTLEDLDEAGEAVFAAQAGDIVGPIQTLLGPALYRVNATLAAIEVPFEEARPLLRETLAQDTARRAIEAQATEYDDLLAGGATLEELASETDLQLGTIGWTLASSEEIAGYEAFRTLAAALTTEDFPEIVELGDGGVFAARLDEIRAPEPQPLADVRDAVIADWTVEATANAVLEEAERMAGLAGSGRTFEALGLVPEVRRDQGRRGVLVSLPANTLDTVFGMDAGDTLALSNLENGSTEAIVLRLDTIRPPEEGDGDVEALRNLVSEQAEAQLAEDLFAALVRDIQSRAGLQLDQQAINAVNTNFP